MTVKPGLRTLMIAALMAPLPAEAEMIHLMARKGDVAAVLKLIEGGVPVDLPSTSNTVEEGVSPLFIAAKFGKVEVVRALLDRGADHSILFRWGENNYYYGTPLHIAARWGHPEVVDVLLNAGADPARYNSFIGTPLHLARLAGQDAIAERLVAAGAPERVGRATITPLLTGANPENGAQTAKGCEICHMMSADGAVNPETGPSLWDIVNRPVASQDGFSYSPAMKTLSGVWDYDALNSYLASPYQYLPGTSKIMIGLEDDAVRANLIAYLRTLSADPAALP